MKESYVEYILSECTDSAVSRVCELYKTRNDLINTAKEGFNGRKDILEQRLLLSGAKDIISDNGYIFSRDYDEDGIIIFSRFKRKLKRICIANVRRKDIDREDLFNALTDLNWLLSSKYSHVQRELHGKIALLSSYSMIRSCTKKALKEIIYKEALYTKERYEQYESAQLIRYHLFPGRHPDDEVRRLISENYTIDEFKELSSQAYVQNIRNMALYYGLTATAARVEEIWRMR